MNGELEKTIIGAVKERLIPRWLAALLAGVAGVGAGVGAPHLPVPPHEHDQVVVTAAAEGGGGGASAEEVAATLLSYIDQRVIYTCGGAGGEADE